MFNSQYGQNKFNHFRERVALSYMCSPDYIQYVENDCKTFKFENMDEELTKYVADIVNQHNKVQQDIFLKIQNALDEYYFYIKQDNKIIQYHTPLINHLIDQISTFFDKQYLIKNIKKYFFYQNYRNLISHKSKRNLKKRYCLSKGNIFSFSPLIYFRHDTTWKNGFRYLKQNRLIKKFNLKSFKQKRMIIKLNRFLQFQQNQMILNIYSILQFQFRNNKDEKLKKYKYIHHRHPRIFKKIGDIKYYKRKYKLKNILNEYILFSELAMKIANFFQQCYSLLKKSQFSDICIEEIFQVFKQGSKTFPQMLEDYQMNLQNYLQSNPAFYLNMEAKLYNLLNTTRILLKQYKDDQIKFIIYFNLAIHVIKKICELELYLFTYKFCKRIQTLVNSCSFSIKNTFEYAKLMISFYYYKGFSQMKFDTNHKFKDYMVCKHYFYEMMYTNYIKTENLQKPKNIQENNCTDIFRENCSSKIKHFKRKKRCIKKDQNRNDFKYKMDFFPQSSLSYIFFRKEGSYNDNNLMIRLFKETIRILKINRYFDFGMNQLCRCFKFQQTLDAKYISSKIRYLMNKDKFNSSVDSNKLTIYEEYIEATPDKINKLKNEGGKLNNDQKKQLIRYLKWLGECHIFNGMDPQYFLNIWRYLSILDRSLYPKFLFIYDQVKFYYQKYCSSNKNTYEKLTKQIKQDIEHIQENKNSEKENRLNKEILFYWQLTFDNQKINFEQRKLEKLEIDLQIDSPIICIRKLMNNIMMEVLDSQNDADDKFSKLFKVNYQQFQKELQAEMNKQKLYGNKIQYTKAYTFNDHQIFLKVFSIDHTKKLNAKKVLFDDYFYQFIQEVAIGQYLREKQHEKGQNFHQSIGYHTFARYIHHFVQDNKIFLILENYQYQWNTILQRHFSQVEDFIIPNSTDTQLSEKSKKSLLSVSRYSSISSIKNYKIISIFNKIHQKAEQTKQRTLSQTSTNSRFRDSTTQPNSFKNLSEKELTSASKQIQEQDNIFEEKIPIGQFEESKVFQKQENIDSLIQNQLDESKKNNQIQQELTKSQSDKGSFNQKCQENSNTSNTNSLLIKYKQDLEIEYFEDLWFKREDLFVCLLRLEQAFLLLMKNNLIHKDIKIDNLVFKGTDEPVIIDFGISDTYQEFSFTMNSSGTVKYSSYQQIEGQPINENTDMTSLIITQYELIIGKKIIISNDEQVTNKAQYISQNAEKELSHIFSKDFIHVIAFCVDCLLDTTKARVKFFMWQKFEIFMNLMHTCLDKSETSLIHNYQRFFSKMKKIIQHREVYKQKCKDDINFDLDKLKDISNNEVFQMLVSLQSHDILKMYESILYLEIRKKQMKLYREYKAKQIPPYPINVMDETLQTDENQFITSQTSEINQTNMNPITDYNYTSKSQQTNMITSQQSNKVEQKQFTLLKEKLSNQFYLTLDNSYKIPNKIEFKNNIYQILKKEHTLYELYQKRYHFNVDKLQSSFEKVKKEILLFENLPNRFVIFIKRTYMKLIKAAYRQQGIEQLALIMENTQKQIFLFQNNTNKQIQKAYHHTESIRLEILKKLNNMSCDQSEDKQMNQNDNDNNHDHDLMNQLIQRCREDIQIITNNDQTQQTQESNYNESKVKEQLIQNIKIKNIIDNLKDIDLQAEEIEILSELLNDSVGQSKQNEQAIFQQQNVEILQETTQMIPETEDQINRQQIIFNFNSSKNNDEGERTIRKTLFHSLKNDDCKE